MAQTRALRSVRVARAHPFIDLSAAGGGALATLTEAVIVECGRYSNIVLRCVRDERAAARAKAFWARRRRSRTRQHKQEQQPIVHGDDDATAAAALKEAAAEAVPLPSHLNTVVLYIDSLSRRHFFRKFPRTTALLNRIYKSKNKNERKKKKKNKGSNGATEQQTTAAAAATTSTSEIFQFFRYHAVSKTTKVNVQAMFVGAQGDAQSHERSVLWEQFSRNGFVTAHIDNSCQDFSAKYQQRTSRIAHEFVPLFCDPEYYLPGKHHGLWHGPFAVRRRCLKGEHVHSYLFEYLREFSAAYTDVPTFAFTAFTEAHEPTGEVVGLLDADLHAYLAELERNEALQRRGELDVDVPSLRNTAVLLVADHGLHLGLMSGLGVELVKYENMYALFDLVLPAWFLEQQPQLRRTLRANEQALVTPCDVFETLRSLIRLGGDARLARAQRIGLEKRNDAFAYSVLDERVPATRTCLDAMIPPRLCRCVRTGFEPIDAGRVPRSQSGRIDGVPDVLDHS
jgi:hypothetical protein